MKLFEIPIYALSRKKLDERVKECQKKLRDNCKRINAPEETINKVIEIETFPKRLWDYNHIIGCIVISVVGCQIKIDLFKELPHITKYYWKSKKKRFVQNACLNGQHFYIGNMKRVDEIRSMLHLLLDKLIEEINSKGLFVDTEAFDNIDKILDYTKLLKITQ